MKQTTKEWITAAGDDLLAAKTLVKDSRLTNIAAFHCQQCIEKCFKAQIEELSLPSVKSHDLKRLQFIAKIELLESESNLLSIINEVYIDSRYPGELGLLPHGKPSLNETEKFIKLCEVIISRVAQG